MKERAAKMTLILGEPISAYMLRKAFYMAKIKNKRVAQMVKHHKPTYAQKRREERIQMRRRIHSVAEKGLRTYHIDETIFVTKQTHNTWSAYRENLEANYGNRIE